MRFNGLDLNLVVALDALFTERSVSKAAVRLGITQSAMSSALNRLREFYQDPLFANIDRKMVPTPMAEALLRPVRDAVIQLGAVTTIPKDFDPASSARSINIIVSDYVLQVLLNSALARIGREAPRMCVTLSALDDQVDVRLERAEIDILITVLPNLSPGHPYQVLFEDDYVVVAASDNEALKWRPLDIELYAALPHVVVTHGRSRIQTFESIFIKSMGVNRTVQVVAPSFSAVAGLIVGTPRIATVHRKLAELMTRTHDVTITHLPFSIPSAKICAQTHYINRHDPELKWVLQVLKDACCELPSALR